MITLDKIKDFQNRLFVIQFTDAHQLEAELIEITELATPENAIKASFSLIFRTQQKDEYFVQGTYFIENPELGSIPIFLVPIGPDKSGMRYQAIFN